MANDGPLSDVLPTSQALTVYVIFIQNILTCRVFRLLKLGLLKPYSEALGAAQYLAVATCPNITYACSQLAQFVQNPGPAHWKALCCLYQYLKATRDLSLVLGGTPQQIIGYSDANGMSSELQKPISGYIYFVNSGAVSWSSKWQLLVTLSTTEAKYVRLTHATKEAIWL